MEKIPQFITTVQEINPEPHPSKGAFDGPYMARARAQVSIEQNAGYSVGVDPAFSYDKYKAYHADLGCGLPLVTYPGYYSWEATFEAESQALALDKARAWAEEVEAKLKAKLLAREESMARWRRRMLEIGVPADLLPET